MQYPFRWTAQSALHFTHWHTCSFRRQLDFSGKHSSHAAITSEDYSFTFPPLYKQVFIYMAEPTVEKMKMTKFRNGSKGDSNQGSLDYLLAGILPLSPCTPYDQVTFRPITISSLSLQFLAGSIWHQSPVLKQWRRNPVFSTSFSNIFVGTLWPVKETN